MGVKTLMLATATLLGATGGAFADESPTPAADVIRDTARVPTRPISGHTATFRRAAFTETEEQPDWHLTPTGGAYIGNRRGDLGGFGVKWQLGTTEMALTHEGMGWRWRF